MFFSDYVAPNAFADENGGDTMIIDQIPALLKNVKVPCKITLTKHSTTGQPGRY